LRVLLLLGLLLREAFSFWTGHPFDFEIWVRTGYWVAHGQTPYSAMGFAPGVSFANDFGGPGLSAAIGYLPFWPLLLGGLYELYVFLGTPSPYVYYFMIKQPVIVCDVLLGCFLYRYTSARGSNKASLVLKVWLFSPFNVIISSLWGMFDAIPMLFVMLALRARPGSQRGFWAGMATFAKSIPLIFAIPLARGPSVPSTIRNLALAIGIPLALSVVAVLLTGWPLSVFGTTMQSTLGSATWSMSLWEIVFYFNYLGVIPDSGLGIFAWAGYAWVAAVAVATVLAYKWFGFDTERGLVRSLILIMASFLLLRGQANEQYAIYLFALVLVDLAVWSPQRKNLILVSMIAVLLATVANNFLLIRFVAPVYPQVEGNGGIEAQVISAFNFERNTLVFLGAMIFGLTNICYIYLLFKERHARTGDQFLTV
jgi:hypothetical protein